MCCATASTWRCLIAYTCSKSTNANITHSGASCQGCISSAGVSEMGAQQPCSESSSLPEVIFLILLHCYKVQMGCQQPCSESGSLPEVIFLILLHCYKVQVPRLSITGPCNLAGHAHQGGLGVDVLRACRLEVGNDQLGCGLA